MAKVRDFMSTDVVTISSRAGLTEAARLMRDEDVGLLPVVDGGEIRGVVTDRDIVIKALAESRMDTTVETIMTADLAWLSPDDDEREARERMAVHDVRRLPVIDNGRIVGIV